MSDQSNFACSYAHLFPEQLANPCDPAAPESNTGPIAYLHALYQKALSIEATSESGQRQTLAQRRPDLAQLVLDPERLEQPVNALALAISTLTHHAQARAGSTVDLPEVLAEAGLHIHLPYHHAHEQIKTVLAHKKIPYFELLQQSLRCYPVFCEAQLRSKELRQAMRMASGFGPGVQQLLLDNDALNKNLKDWRKWYGLQNTTEQKAIASLKDVETFMDKTGLAFEQVLELLAISSIDDEAKAGHSTVRTSEAYQPTSATSLPDFHPGAVFINALSKVRLTLKDTLSGAGIKPTFNRLDYNCLPRIYQMIHLQRELGLPFAETDLLVISILRAEGQKDAWNVTPTTLRALGVFRYLNEAYDISAEQFAALVCEVCPYAFGVQPAMLDRVLDGPGSTVLDTSSSLVLDDRALDPQDGAEGQLEVLPGLAKALGADEQTTLDWLGLVKNAQPTQQLTLSLSLLSALYRLSRLPRLLKRSRQETDALLKLLADAGIDVQAQLSGTPLISDFETTGILDVLIALTNLDQWLRQQQILPSALLVALNLSKRHATGWIEGHRPKALRLHQAAIDAALTSTPINSDASASEPVDEPAQHTALIAQLLADVLGLPLNTPGFTQSHVQPLINWVGKSHAELLQAADSLRVAGPAQASDKGQSWLDLESRCAVSVVFSLSPAMIQCIADHPGGFALERSDRALTLDVCYKLACLKGWVAVSAEHGRTEEDVLGFFKALKLSTLATDRQQFARAMATLCAWTEEDVATACPPYETLVEVEDTRPTFNDFLQTLSADELATYKHYKIETLIRRVVVRVAGTRAYNDSRFTYLHRKLVTFLDQHPGPLLVTEQQYKDAYKPDKWLAAWKTVIRSGHEYHPLELEVASTAPGTVSRSVGIPGVPTSIRQIDYILRMKSLAQATGLACRSLLDLTELTERSSYRQYEASSQLLLASTDDALRANVDAQIAESWRDALTGYLIGHGAKSAGDALVTFTQADDLCTYCLCDILVSPQVQTTLLDQAIGSLQHYLSRIHARLEPGYLDNAPSGEQQLTWQGQLGQYGTWKRNREQLNHPANLIHYAHRTNKSKAFQELEIELNQGKMDTTLLHTAICNYLTKFERISNLQVVSGYLDGHDPKRNTYHLVARTNSTPLEYYWRTLDISLCDDKRRLSPLAWSEWEAISLSPAGEIVGAAQPDSRADLVRPVVIAGRRYVFWVERSTTDLGSGTDANATLPKKRKLTVNYCFQQSDDTWSTPNEILCLDGFLEGSWQPDTHAKGPEFEPGLIVTVNQEAQRRNDPWLTVLLYDRKMETGHVQNKDYYLVFRDLLLLEKKSLNSTEADSISRVLINSFGNPHAIAHPYDGEIFVTSLVESYTAHHKSSRKFSNLFEDEATFITITNADDKSKKLKRLDNYSAFTKSKSKHDLLVEDYTIESLNSAAPIQAIPDTFIDFQPDDIASKTPLDFELKIIRKEDSITIHVTTPLKKLHASRDDCSKIEIISTFNGVNSSKVETFTDGMSISSTHVTGLKFFLTYIDSQREALPTWSLREYKIDPSGMTKPWSLSIAANAKQAQYLDLSAVKHNEPLLITDKFRLNTLFGKNLVARASQGVERVLGWDTQSLTEPALDDSDTSPPTDFHGANALYLRELFLHVPAMVAMRLTEQQQFEEAEDWYLRYLFNPYRTKPDAQGRPAPWCTRPLAEAGTLSSTLSHDVDPVTWVFLRSRYYQEAVYLSLLENWQLQGDHFYRQLTLSSLNQAWLCYQQALQLLGPLAKTDLTSRWTPVALAELKVEALRRPINPRLARLHQTLKQRLFNLRHGLTLDGKVLPALDWNSETLEAFSSNQGTIGSQPAIYRRTHERLPHYRFRHLLPIAKQAANELAKQGGRYLALMEGQLDKKLLVLRQTHHLKMADFAIRLQQKSINSLQSRKSGLLLTQSKTTARLNRLSHLIDIGRSPEEEAATAFTWIGNSAKLLSIPFEIAGAAVEAAVPTIYGMAVGGIKPAAPMYSTAKSLKVASEVSGMLAAELKTQAGYNRRAATWAFEKSEAQWDLRILGAQLDELELELGASKIELARCIQDRNNLREAHASMTDSFSIAATYDWLTARQEQIYGSAYDAVRSLCQMAESAWRLEIGDYRRASFLDAYAWRDKYKGMLAGDSLLQGLQQMENEYLLNSERRLTIRKTFSLNEQLGQAQWDKLFKRQPDADSALALNFAFSAADFDKSYPGHYLRQLKHVSVTLVMKNRQDPTELSAVLTQLASNTLLEPHRIAAASLYPVAETATAQEKEAHETAAQDPALVLRNPGVNQQIALSVTDADDGVGHQNDSWLYELALHDGRYLPFEGTGAISQWELKILGDEALLKDLSVITDIKLNMVYTAKTGDQAFTDAVYKLLEDAKEDTPSAT
ncbi:Tc toxin subunit A [Pseudomonas putida]|uniref:Virulence plasmid A protein n=1 Tax=Pseudomonas putida TaxID=303 RepID=A0AAD0LAW2_PSEPU|nr:neuraminidase-like domain-containing protein [Pseudomonas putida]AXA26951.1 hypothetical protein C1S65_23600 [Pseudomonas putida]